MIREDDWKMAENIINKNFVNLTGAKREKMLEQLKEISRSYEDARIFCSYSGSHLAKIGLRYNIGKDGKGTFYFITEWYDELMDL